MHLITNFFFCLFVVFLLLLLIWWDITDYSSGLMIRFAAPLQIFVRGGTELPEVTFSLFLPSFVQSAVIMQSFAIPAKNVSLLLRNTLLPSLRTKGLLSYFEDIPNSSLRRWIFISVVLRPCVIWALYELYRKLSLCVFQLVGEIGFWGGFFSSTAKVYCVPAI